MTRKTIMIVEDEKGIREMTKMYLVKSGYDVIAVRSGSEALEKIDHIQPHLILLDIEMPGMNGFTLCQKIREKYSMPIIFLTVRRDTADKVKGFEVGGDDYMTKPFKFNELEARIKANIRRHYSYSKGKERILQFNNLTINLDTEKVYLNDELVNLTVKEKQLLFYLAQHPNQVWSQDELYDKVWDEHAVGNYDTVKVHINYLRNKLESDLNKPTFIKTVRGFGYLFADG